MLVGSGVVSVHGAPMFKTLALTVASTGFAAFVVSNGLGGFFAQGEKPRLVPPPVVDRQAASAASEVAVLAGGCFWGVQGVYQHVNGVSNAVSGYAGGAASTAEYELVTTGRTGHAEAVEVTFDPRVISFGRLLQVFFSVAHDPTQLNRQGPDIGTQYRSAIFPTSSEQATIAEAFIAQLNQARVYPSAIVTKIETGRTFYRAEDDHQDFLVKNPGNPYIRIHDLPKLTHLKQLFPDLYSAKPILVGSR
jgi:peptide-methionine (S)-S-oxide reductase